MSDMTYFKNMTRNLAVIASVATLFVAQVSAQNTQAQTTSAPPPVQQPASPAKPGGKPVPPPPVLVVPPDYRIGLGDVLVVNVWREDSASGEIMVRPDGKVTPKMLDDIMALNLTTEELKKLVEEGLKKFFTEGVPPVQIQVKAINSRNVFITGAVNKPGPYPIIGQMNLNQLIALAGGLQEFANKKKVLLIRGTLKDKNGQPVTLFINYEELQNGKNVQRNNPDLMPGDQVIVGGG
jgi:polysaccharide export outer membrane protein